MCGVTGISELETRTAAVDMTAAVFCIKVDDDWIFRRVPVEVVAEDQGIAVCDRDGESKMIQPVSQ